LGFSRHVLQHYIDGPHPARDAFIGNASQILQPGKSGFNRFSVIEINLDATKNDNQRNDERTRCAQDASVLSGAGFGHGGLPGDFGRGAEL
jgi:hypothetical protein